MKYFNKFHLIYIFLMLFLNAPTMWAYKAFQAVQFPSTMTQSPFSILKLCVYIQKHSLVNS